MIELSSGEEDTLHIVDSSESVSEEDEEEEKGGTHVNDVLNQRDALGRVLVNLNHPPEEENVFLAPQLAQAVKPHQVRQVLTLFFVPVAFLAVDTACLCLLASQPVKYLFGTTSSFWKGLVLLPNSLCFGAPDEWDGTRLGVALPCRAR